MSFFYRYSSISGKTNLNENKTGSCIRLCNTGLQQCEKSTWRANAKGRIEGAALGALSSAAFPAVFLRWIFTGENDSSLQTFLSRLAQRVEEIIPLLEGFLISPATCAIS